MVAKPTTRKTRAPQQKRSIDKTEKILKAAYTVFCTKGFYRTTTTTIAKKAGVSIGALYSYFRDKEDLFMAILERYMEEFEAARTKMLYPPEGRELRYPQFVRSIMTALLKEHEASKELNREIDQLSYAYPAIAARMEKQHEGIVRSIGDYLHAHRDALRVNDIDAAAMVVWQLTNGLVHHIVFKTPAAERDRLLDAGVEALCAYLIK
jgi:AcrR family transcriptional regulator